MGTLCSSNIYEQVKKEYGEQLTKYVVAEKTKQYLLQKVSTLKRNINEQVIKMKLDHVQQIGTVERKVQNSYQEVKAELDKKIHGRSQSLQGTYNQPVEQLLGYNQIHQKIDLIKSNLESRYQETKNELFNQIDIIQQEQIQKINQPHLALVNQLQPQQKISIFRKGEKQFSEIISWNQSYVSKEIGEKLVLPYYLNQFKQILPTGSLNGLPEVAHEKFVAAAQILIKKDKR